MGNCCLPIRFRKTSTEVNLKNITLLVVGLDNSGKTTIVKRLTGEPVDSVVPTVGFSVATLRKKTCRVSMYDLGGGPQIRDIWPRYYADAHGLVFVVDAHDSDRMEECRQVLRKVLENDQISGKPVLLLANKQDFEGAFDEIDVVDYLNLEAVVNEQKCPTLVELCSALQFTKKVDVGIDNGFRWLIRSVIKDYSSLNNRVLKDLARLEEENKVHIIRSKKAEVSDKNTIESFVHGDPFKPLEKVLEEKKQANGVIKRVKKPAPRIPGLVEEVPENHKIKKPPVPKKFLGEEIVSVEEPSTSNYCSEFFMFEHFQSDVELLKEVPNHSLKNFLVRPKSSGARLYGVRPERKKVQKKKQLIKGNKTGPSPFTDITDEHCVRIPKALKPIQNLSEINASPPSDEESHTNRSQTENRNPFVVSTYLVDERRKSETELKVFTSSNPPSKSTPNSRKNSGSSERARKRRRAMANSKNVNSFSKIERYSPGLMDPSKEVILEVRQLRR